MRRTGIVRLKGKKFRVVHSVKLVRVRRSVTRRRRKVFGIF